MWRHLKTLTESRPFQNFVIGTIFASVLLVGAETYPWVRQHFAPTLERLDQIILAIFTLEILLRIGAHGVQPWKFFINPWNLFDFLIVALCYLPESQFIAVLRLVRIMRVLRLLATVREKELERLKNEELTEAYRRLEEEKLKSERLLLNILPLLIAQRLKSGVKVIADTYPQATVLFADIVGFTALSSNIPPQELVNLLDRIFSRFDDLVEKYQVEKIKTIGDAYMVVSGLPDPREDHVKIIAELALDMFPALEAFNRQQKQTLRLRIGFHCGPVVAGIIGQKKFIYDLWGDTVNIASRMESRSLPNRIQISREAAEILQADYRIEPRGKVEIKGKGFLPTYFLLGRKETDEK